MEINPHPVDFEWVNSNHEVITAWSSFELLWAIHHDILLNAKSNLYPEIARTHGYTGAEQAQAFSELIDRRNRVQEIVFWMSDEYSRHHISSLAHKDIPETSEAVISASNMVRELYNVLQDNALAINEIGDALTQGRYGFVNDAQRKFLLALSGFNKGLLALSSCLAIWMSVREN